MKKVKCENGHFYDMDRYDVCPLCGQQSGEVPRPRSIQPDPDVTVKLPESIAIDDFAPVDEIVPDEPFFPEADDEPVVPVFPGTAETGEGMHTGKMPSEESAALAETQPQFPSLVEAVITSNAAAVPVFPIREKKSDDHAAALPVGFLVGLSSSNRGKVFFCKTGMNHIGSNMDIVLTDERSVNQDTHAIIIYEPKKRQFFIRVGIGLNGKMVFANEELHAYDRITLGEAEFLFLPLCGESFDWDENTHGK